jgi:glycosyltransferase involved in cell wall biosynthesis
MINNSGIGVYIKNYIYFLLESDNLYNIVLLGSSKELNILFSRYSNWSCIEFNVPIYSIKEQFSLPFKIPLCDVFWSPYYNVPLFPIRAVKRLVTIPDAAHLALAKTFKFGVLKRLYSKIVFKSAVILSDTVLTISNFSKTEIVKFTKSNPSKIHVIHLGIDKTIFKNRKKDGKSNEVLLKYNLPENYILFVGNVKPHKNLKGLIKAFDVIKNDIPLQKILIVGKKEGFITGDNEVFSLIKELDLEDRIIFTGYVSSEDLPYLYQLAKLFVFPSIYEGFGFPPLEAMACGCPVLTSKMASMPEICKNAVEYMDVTNVENMSSEILRLLNDEEQKQTLLKKGESRVQEFSWDRSGLEFENVLRNIL